MPPAPDVRTSPTLLRQLAGPGNEAAWRTFLQRYGPLIYHWCCRAGLAHDDAEEVSQAVLAKLVTALRTFVYDPARLFRAWLRKVVENEVRDLWRLRARRPGDRGSGHPRAQGRLEQAPARQGVDELVQEVDEAFQRDLRQLQQIMAWVQARVQPRSWEAFWRTAMEQEPAAEVARRLGMRVGAVYQAKNRVGQLLRERGARQQALARAAGGASHDVLS
jgi:RNA polymerase sigma-70 factor (ECF subfamily)